MSQIYGTAVQEERTVGPAYLKLGDTPSDVC
jgi:hypothetical protein